jgi:signal transduction histidine kinase
MQSFSQFIAANVDKIVDDFERFARTSGPSAANLDAEELRDHAKVVLQAIAADMATFQSGPAQDDKSKGEAVNAAFSQVLETGRTHAQHRFEQGFLLPQMVSEYRALRASVIRRWNQEIQVAQPEQLAELTRFNEAIDEALTEAVVWYAAQLEHSRNLLIGVLAHDLRGPLGAVSMSAMYLLRADRLKDEDLRAVARIASSSAKMAGYVNDLLDFARTLLGGGLPLTRTSLDFASLCEEMVDELRAANPAATIKLEVNGFPTGSWDGPRLTQLLSNLVINAIIHGDSAHPVNVTLAEVEGDCVLEVHNAGRTIPKAALAMLFQPHVSGTAAPAGNLASSGLGLGLYIARSIAVAHGGTIDVKSADDEGTTFTVRLPSG